MDGMSKDRPLVSVIIASYNHARYVGLAIESVLRQTWSGVELIVLDDGSTDGSPDLIAPLAEQHGFRFERHANIGLPATLNKGIALSGGKYIAPLGSDDMVFPDKLEKQVRFMEQRPDIAICGGNALIIDDDGTVVARQRVRPYRELDFNDVLLFRKNHPPSPTLLLRRSSLEKAGGYDTGIQLEDLYMYLRTTRDGDKIAVLNDVLAYYRKHRSNTHKDFRFMVDNTLETLARFQDSPLYGKARDRYLVSMFLKVAGRDKGYAVELLRDIHLRNYNWKVVRGLLRLLVPAKNEATDSVP